MCGSCPCCIFVAADSYSSCFFIGPYDLVSWGLCSCVIHACCHRYDNTAAAAAERFSWAAECGRDFQPLLRCILFYFRKYYPTNVLLCSVCHTCVCGVCPVSLVECFQTFFGRQSLVLLGRGLNRQEHHNKAIYLKLFEVLIDSVMPNL